MLAVIGLATVAVTALVSGALLEARHRRPDRLLSATWAVLRLQRRQYAGFLIHIGFVCLAVGIAGSGLGKREQGFTLTEGQKVSWAGWKIHVVRLIQRELPDKIVGEVELTVAAVDGPAIRLFPAQHFHRLQEQWTTEVAISRSWRGDFYAILHSGELDGRLFMTFVENPLMSWVWAGGAIMVLGAGVRLWPGRRKRTGAAIGLPIAALDRSEEAAPRRRRAA
jgi:cytochrome c-type biogenesis protein CcmF